MNPNARNLDFAGNAPRMKGESDMRDEGMQDSGIVLLIARTVHLG